MKKYLLILMVPLLMFGCSDKPDSVESLDGVTTKDSQAEQKTEKENKKTLSDEELKAGIVEKYGKTNEPVFTLVEESSLTAEELEKVKLHQNAVGVSYLGKDLFTIVAKSEENSIRYITEALVDEENIHVFIRKGEAGTEGKEMLIGKIKGFDDMKEMVWFMDAENEQPIQLEDLESVLEQENDEKSEATDVESTDKEKEKE